jgi:predicted Zn-ribbon and HTH transcriptional regulator
MTVRKAIIALLSEKKMSLRDIALYFRITPKEVSEDLLHIGQSTYPKQELRMEIPVCRTCGYMFKDRKKITRPSRCPKCKKEAITEPKFWIVDNIKKV